MSVVAPAVRRFVSDPVTGALATRALSGSEITMYDDTDISQLPNGAAAYAAYYDGSFTNYNAVKTAHPDALLLSITNGFTVADYPNVQTLDIEPGNVGNSSAVPFYRAHNGTSVYYYTSAGNAQALIDTLASAGIPRANYKLWSAHWIGPHICSPTSCGYPRADATQYTNLALGRSLDASLVLPGFFLISGTPTLVQGDTGPDVSKLQRRLNVWAPFDKQSIIASDGVFGAATLASVKGFQKYAFGPAGVDGIVGPATWATVLKTPPSPSQWRFTPPRNLVVRGGKTTVHLAWDAPGDPVGKKPTGYQVVIYNSPPVVDKGVYKVVVARQSKGLELQIGSLKPGNYITHVWALGSSATSDSNFEAGAFTVG